MKRLFRLTLLSLLVAAPASAGFARTQPPAAGLTSHFVDLPTGVRMHYVEQGRNRSRGKVVIFLHGYTDSWRSFERNLPLLSDKFHAYAIDQRGHGLHVEWPQEFVNDLEAFAK
ncbi:MAG TPA: alpha/beta fold hydrolase [Pyrinomonadaceae bacterium]|nr:alpha/beta fold hydrolase [Pyrinomonadaceae bacterium]